MKCFKDLVSLVFPYQCLNCGLSILESENQLCFTCINELPYTLYFHINENPVQKLFWGRVEIEFAASLLQFESESATQRILHHLKYRNNPKIGVEMGKILGIEFQKSRFKSDICGIVPVPIHSRKLRKRGYNQSMCLAKGLAMKTGIQICERTLIRKDYSKSQTKMNRVQRWGNVSESFHFQDADPIKGNHLLIVDDVITTGATIEACAHKLIEAGFKVSVISLARTS